MSGVKTARKLRRTMSPPEIALWQHLRGRPAGFKFRRQHPIGRYTVDFYCRAAAVAIEVDGNAHDLGDRPDRDAERDSWLAGEGIVTLRFLARDVLREMQAVMMKIEEVCASRSPPPRFARAPSPRNRGED